jgi:hypothetical protein
MMVSLRQQAPTKPCRGRTAKLKKPLKTDPNFPSTTIFVITAFVLCNQRRFDWKLVTVLVGSIKEKIDLNTEMMLWVGSNIAFTK